MVRRRFSRRECLRRQCFTKIHIKKWVKSILKSTIEQMGFITESFFRFNLRGFSTMGVTTSHTTLKIPKNVEYFTEPHNPPTSLTQFVSSVLFEGPVSLRTRFVPEKFAGVLRPLPLIHQVTPSSFSWHILPPVLLLFANPPLFRNFYSLSSWRSRLDGDVTVPRVFSSEDRLDDEILNCFVTLHW